MYSRLKCRIYGLRFVPPNYAFIPKLIANDGIAIDVGVGDIPDLSLFLIHKYQIESYIVDPTLKHMNKLKDFERKNRRVHYLPLALGARNELRTFYESQSNESGSLQKDHKNVKTDEVTTYNVQVVTLDTLVRQCGNKTVSIMKIDLEGEEYDFVHSISKHNLRKNKQLIIEFHHGIVDTYSINETTQSIKTIEKMGMKSILYNGRDCLFYWEKWPLTEDTNL
jgi:FkbM family methyltransferase